jgi:peptidoglycan hydrolase-like protein with peptidoglycan-binding domain
MADERDAFALEDENPLGFIGEEADPPGDTGRGPSEEDLAPPAEDGGGDEDAEAAGGTAGTWRVAKCLVQLRQEVDGRWPNRDRRTDGTIGDLHHCGAGHTSDHCPNAQGVVRAFDIDADGIATAFLAEHLRQLGLNGDQRFRNGGYVIYNRRIASEVQGFTWRQYTGDSPHTDHIHVSVSRDAAGYDALGDWGVRHAVETPVTPHPVSADTPEHRLGSRILQLKQPHMRGTDVGFVQRFTGTEDTGEFEEKTKARVIRYQGIVGLAQSGVVDALTWRAMRVN